MIRPDVSAREYLLALALMATIFILFAFGG